MSVSYPYWTIARDLKLDYGYVLSTLAYLEKNPNAVDYWTSFTGDYWSGTMYWRVARAFKAEMERRKQ